MAKATSEALLTKQVRQQDANPTVRRPYGQSSPKWEKFIPDSIVEQPCEVSRRYLFPPLRNP